MLSATKIRYYPGRSGGAIEEIPDKNGNQKDPDITKVSLGDLRRISRDGRAAHMLELQGHMSFWSCSWGLGSTATRGVGKNPGKPP